MGTSKAAIGADGKRRFFVRPVGATGRPGFKTRRRPAGHAMMND